MYDPRIDDIFQRLNKIEKYLKVTEYTLLELYNFINENIARSELIQEREPKQPAQFWARYNDMKKIRGYLIDLVKIYINKNSTERISV